jgi:hypothetical protein
MKTARRLSQLSAPHASSLPLPINKLRTPACATTDLVSDRRSQAYGGSRNRALSRWNVPAPNLHRRELALCARDQSTDVLLNKIRNGKSQEAGVLDGIPHGRERVYGAASMKSREIRGKMLQIL